MCEGGTLLSWMGAFRREPFTARERRILDRLVRPLRPRLRTRESPLQRRVS